MDNMQTPNTQSDYARGYEQGKFDAEMNAINPQSSDKKAVCLDCNKDYEEFGLDITLPNAQWNAIAERLLT